AGWTAGRDLALRRRVGHIATEEALGDARRARDADRRALAACLERNGATDGPASPRAEARVFDSPVGICGAVHRFLARTPAVMVGLALDDLAGEREPVNLPGAGVDAYPSWTRKMHRALDELTAAEDVRRALDDVPRLRGNAPSSAAIRRRRAPRRATA